MLKLNKLFYYTSERKVFLDNINPTSEQQTFLNDCRTTIREYLRPLIADATISVLGMKSKIEPKFRTQGSWSYATCIQPAHASQEMDWDYGIYLPVDVWESNGPPAKMALAYFQLVERLLIPLCQKMGWKLMKGKSTCIRISVSDWAHMDIPLYAAPQEEFEKIRERLLVAKATASYSEALDSMSMEDSAQDWSDIISIVMATRDGLWVESDPEEVARWFGDRISEHGEQLRRVCKYLKSWRDYHWENGGPSSVAIMIAISNNFTSFPGRDDKALAASARVLANGILTDLIESSISEEKFNRLSSEDRAIASTRAQNLANIITRAMSRLVHEKTVALIEVVNQFGNRIPNSVDLIDLDTGADSVRSAPALIVSKPIVGSSISG